MALQRNFITTHKVFLLGFALASNENQNYQNKQGRNEQANKQVRLKLEKAPRWVNNASVVHCNENNN